MSRGTCTLIVSCRNQRRNSIMRNGVLWTDHPPEQLASGIYGSEDMQVRATLPCRHGTDTPRAAITHTHPLVCCFYALCRRWC